MARLPSGTAAIIQPAAHGAKGRSLFRFYIRRLRPCRFALRATYGVVNLFCDRQYQSRWTISECGVKLPQSVQKRTEELLRLALYVRIEFLRNVTVILVQHADHLRICGSEEFDGLRCERLVSLL